MKKIIFIITLLVIGAISSFPPAAKEAKACPSVQFEVVNTGSCSMLPLIPTTVYIDANSCLENGCAGSGEYVVTVRNAAGNVVFTQTAVNYMVSFNPCSFIRVPPSGCSNFTIEVAFFCNSKREAWSVQTHQVCA